MVLSARALLSAISVLIAASTADAVNFAVLQEISSLVAVSKLAAKSKAAVLSGSSQLESWDEIMKTTSKRDAKALGNVLFVPSPAVRTFGIHRLLSAQPSMCSQVFRCLFDAFNDASKHFPANEDSD